MSQLTTNTDLFGALGVSDPAVFFPTIAYRREIDFSVANTAANTNYELLPIPKGFVAKAVVVEELEACDGASNSVTVAGKSNGTAFGSAVPVGGDDLAFTAAAMNQAFSAGDILCFKTATATKKGKVAISVVGYCTSEESLATAQCPTVWRNTLQTQDNVSGGQIDKRKFEGESKPVT